MTEKRRRGRLVRD